MFAYFTKIINKDNIVSLYFNDDDTIIHPNLWNSIKDVKENFISFMQNSKDGNLRLSGKEIRLNEIDSHNFVVNINTIKNIRLDIDRYDADGAFAETVYKNANTVLYIPKVLSTYNFLR